MSQMQLRPNPKIQPLLQHPVQVSRSVDVAFEAPAGVGPISYFSCSKQQRVDALSEKFRHSTTVTHIALGHEPTIALESVANAHTAADLHVRPVSKTALVLKIVGAASHLRNTQWQISRNPFDRSAAATLRTSCSATLRVKKASF